MHHFPHAFPLLHINKKGQKTSLDLQRFRIRYGVTWTNCLCWSNSIKHKDSDGKHSIFQFYKQINNQNHHKIVAESFLFVMARSKTIQQDLKSKCLTSSLNLPLATSSSTSPWPPSGTTSRCSCPSKLQKNLSSKNKSIYVGWSVGSKNNKRQKLRFSTLVASRKQQATWCVCATSIREEKHIWRTMSKTPGDLR